MTLAGQIIQQPEKRKNVRVIFTRSVKLIIDEEPLGQFPIRDLSIGGLFIEGDFNLVSGQDCKLELYETGRHSSLILTFDAQVTRIEEHGIAIAFTDMAEDSFMFLQTMVLYSSDDPIGVAEGFLEDFSPDSSSRVC